MLIAFGNEHLRIGVSYFVFEIIVSAILAFALITLSPQSNTKPLLWIQDILDWKKKTWTQQNGIFTIFTKKTSEKSTLTSQC